MYRDTSREHVPCLQRLLVVHASAPRGSPRICDAVMMNLVILPLQSQPGVLTYSRMQLDFSSTITADITKHIQLLECHTDHFTSLCAEDLTASTKLIIQMMARIFRISGKRSKRLVTTIVIIKRM